MIKVVFECFENRNEYSEEFEFEDGTTDEQIEEEYKEWVWEQIRDNFGWRRV
jgi:hypothetical protein